MKTSIALLFAASAVCTSVAFAQDAAVVSPKNFKVLGENDKVRVLEYTAKKGEKMGMHSHPSIACYALKASRTKYTMPDGTTSERSSKKGEVLLRDPVTHAQQALSDSHAICMELKK